MSNGTIFSNDSNYSDAHRSNETNGTSNGNTRAVILETFMWIYSLIGLYVFISLLVYERALHIQRRHESVSQLLIHASKGSPQRFGIYLRTVNILAAVILVCRTAVEHAEILLEVFTDQDHCGIVVTLKIVLAGFFFTAIYLFLWVRQRMCYNNPFMSRLSSSFTHVLSWASLAALIVAEVITVGLFVFTRTYKRTTLGCDIDETNIPPFLAWLVYGVSTAAFQVTFLILFILPLLKQRNVIRSQSIRLKSQAHKVLPLVWRSFYACVVCVVTNLVVSVILILADEKYNVVPIILYNFNLVVNLLAVVASFSKWRVILLPCRNRGQKVASLDDTRALEIDTTSSRRDVAQRESILVRLNAERQSSVFTISNPESSILEEFSADGEVFVTTFKEKDLEGLSEESLSPTKSRLPPLSPSSIPHLVE